MKKTHTALISGVLLLTACGDNATTPTPTADGGGVQADGGARNFGTETATGPRVGGTRTGMVTVGGSTGVGYDISGDGTPDEIDVDGDGVSDGEDIDGDGVITVWNDLRQGSAPSANPANEAPEVDPDLFETLDPASQLSNSSSTGAVTEPARVLPMNSGDLLRSISQGNQGSCAAFAVAAAATLTRHRRESAAMAGLDANTLWASPSWLYTRMVQRFPTTCNEGTNVGQGLDLLVLGGSATLAEQPYRSATMRTLCEPIEPNVAQNSDAYRIGSRTFVPNGPRFRAQVREALAAGLPVAFGVALPLGFGEFRSTVAGVDVTQTFRGMGRCMDSVHCGGHAMVFVGYDDTRMAYRVLNSWGPDWGDNGYLWWDYASLEALPQLEANVIVPLPDAPTPLGAPDPTGFSVTLPTGAQPVFTTVTNGSGETDRRIIIRARFSEPINLTALVLQLPDSGAITTAVSTTMMYGDLSAWASEAMPPAGAMATLTIRGTLRNGMAVERPLTFMVPAFTAAN
jgi:hypothetical protein